jgi:3-hydroxyethyl bacteriochlorophyllide a dehydrogenase
MKTQAIVIPELNSVELREVELTPPGPGDLVVRTAYTSISAGTERMLLAGRMPHPMLSFPIVPGYETVGRVVGVGADAPPELEGRWVYIGGARCFAGVNPAWGGQAATLIADHRRVVPLDGVEPRYGVLLALAATALHGIDLLGDGRWELGAGYETPTPNPQLASPAQRVLVLGQGPVGQLAARIARGRGVWVAAADRAASRLARSQADLAIQVHDQITAEQLGEPVTAIVEASGSMAALAGALPLLADGGTVLLLGYYDELRLPYMPLFLKQARLLTAREWAPGDLARCRDMLAAGALDVAGLLTHTLPIARFAEAYAVALNDAECLKLVLEWDNN